MSRSVLVIAAHPDDELLGCGGTLIRHAQEGDTVHIVILAEGATSRDSANDTEAVEGTEELKLAAADAARIVGAEPPILEGLPDNRMDRLELLDITKLVEMHVRRTRPAIVYTHHGGDLNIDHQLTHQAVLTACRPVGSGVEAIYAFETLSSTEWGFPDRPFVPNRFVNIENQLDQKLKALACYTSEMRDFPHPRSPEAVEALARGRGASSGLPAAEGFMVVREIV